MVRVDVPVERYLEALCRRGITHHAILTYGDLRAKLQKVADLLDIRTFVL